MKRLNKKLITFLLAGACVASLSAATIGVVSSAEETTDTTAVAISEVFASNGSLGSKKLSEKETVCFTLADGQYARLKRDLAFKWYTAKNTAKYMNVKFTFEELNFDSVTFTFESATSVVNEEDEAVNAVKFTTDGTNLKVAIVDASGTESAKRDLGATKEVEISLYEGTEFDTFGVKVNSEEFADGFVNVGANYGDFAGEMRPLEIKAETSEDKKVAVFLQEINGQLFDNVANAKITDTAAPVLVVNEELSGFQYGTAFSLSYEKVDVLQFSSLTETKKYYQYNPADKKLAYDAALTTSTYFMDTVYYENAAGTEFSKEKKEGFTKTSVRVENNGEEYVAIQFTLSDNAKKEGKYELSWYVDDALTKEFTLAEDTAANDYIVIDQNEDGPTYKHIVNDEPNTKIEYAYNGKTGDEAKADFEADVAEYEEKIKKEIEGDVDDQEDDILAGSDSKLPLPNVEWLIGDNGGYRGLRFTISYKTPTSTSAKTSSGLSYNGLKLTVSEEGTYEFKIFATDKAGNPMKYYVDGELVDVTATNVWDIDEIPSFTFSIEDSPIAVSDATNVSDKKVEKILDQTYTLSGLKVVGATNQKSEYALYKLDLSKAPEIKESMLTSVKYSEISKKANEKIAAGTDKDYFELYKEIYAELLADNSNGAVTAADVLKCFTEIKEYNSKITEENDSTAWNAYNKYNWNPTSKSFKTAEEGEYLILADFYEDGLFNTRAVGYKLIVVDSEKDVIAGDSEFGTWIKNNMVSVILFGVAGLMLIAIIVLLLVKPSDETLEDVEVNAEKKKKKKAKETQDE